MISIIHFNDEKSITFLRNFSISYICQYSNLETSLNLIIMIPDSMILIVVHIISINPAHKVTFIRKSLIK